MPHDFSTLAALPGLRIWLVPGRWKSGFDLKTLARAKGYASDRFIRQMQIAADSSGLAATISAHVYGTAPKPYHTEVRVACKNGFWAADPDCSCPVGTYCKHAAGLLFLATAALSREESTDPPPVSRDVVAWLAKIESAARAAPMVDSPAKPENRFLAYCIEQPAHGDGSRLNFVLRVGTHKKDGAIAISETRATSDPSRPPKYMTPQDLAVISVYYRRSRQMQSRGEMAFSGTGWNEILAGGLYAGTVFHGREGTGDYRPVHEGPPMAVTATWKILPSGGAQPVLECENPSCIVIPTLPPRYLDSATGALGLLESPLPAAILHAWLDGPPITGRDLTTVSSRFATISNTTLPCPAKIETETRPAAPPQPHLRVYSRMVGSKWERQTILVGLLNFRYSDSSLLPPLTRGQLQSHADLRQGKRIIWPRDLTAEQALVRQLEKSGLLPLDRRLPPLWQDAATHHSFVPEMAIPTQQLAWIDLLHGTDFQALRDAGWTIEVDPKTGLIFHDAVEFFPALEADPDHGIDWFRFDISFELQGKQVSLIPIIAQAIRMNLPAVDSPDFPEYLTLACENPEDGFMRFPAARLVEMVEQVRHLFHGQPADGPLRVDRLAAAGVADTLALDSSETTRALAQLGHRLKHLTSLPPAEIPRSLRAELRPYQAEGYRWLQFLAAHGLHGILADDMGLGKTVQALAHLAAEQAKQPGLPSLVIAPTSVVPNWAAEAEKFTPHLKVLTLQGKDRAGDFSQIATSDLVITSYPLLTRDFSALSSQRWHVIILDEAQYIKNPKALSAQNAFQLKAAHRLCLSGTPMENHLGELWSLMRFLMPGFLSDEKTFSAQIRRPIERDRSSDAQLALNRRVSPLILRRTKDQVATELPAKTELIHGIELTKKQSDLYESVRAAMDQRVREAIAEQGLAKSHIIVLDALLKLRQICCHPQLLKSPVAQKTTESAKLAYLTDELLPTLLEEGRRILLFSTFTSMLALIEAHLEREKIPYLKLTGQTKERSLLVKKFQEGATPIFLISLKAGGTGLNLTAADTVIHYDPWWNPAAENQATDRAHRIGQTKPVFVHKLVCRGTIEDRILELQKHKAALVEALLSDETSKLRIDAETLSHLLAPLE